MEVCPYCKKPFKRLKSHLPYCKMIQPTLPAEQNVCQSKQAPLPRAKKMKSPIRDLAKAESREGGTKSEKRRSKLIRDKPEQTVDSFPLPAAGLERSGNAEAGKGSRNQIRLSLEMLKDPEPKMALHGGTEARFYASQNTAPQRELAKDLPERGKSRSSPSKTKASLPFGPVEPLSNQDEKYSSALPNDVQPTSAHLNVHKIDPLRQKPLVKLLDLPVDDHSSPLNRTLEGKRVRTSCPTNETGSKAWDHLSEAGTDVRDAKNQEKNVESHVFGFKVSLLGKVQVKENPGKGLDLGVEAHGNKGHAERRSLTGGHVSCSMSGDSKSFGTDELATEKKPRGEGPVLNLLTPREMTCHDSLSVSQARNQRLASLAIRFLPEEKAEASLPTRVPEVQALVKTEEQASSTQQRMSKSLLAAQTDVAGRQPLPSALGLEWFPDLYPAYLALGLLPGKPQHWNPVSQKPQLISPQGERLSQVPLLERSSAALRSWEPPPRLTTSSVSLMRLLDAVQKGWIKYSATVRSGVGGVTVLFAGYFALCCSWSFRHLKLPHQRKLR